MFRHSESNPVVTVGPLDNVGTQNSGFDDGWMGLRRFNTFFCLVTRCSRTLVRTRESIMSFLDVPRIRIAEPLLSSHHPRRFRNAYVLTAVFASTELHRVTIQSQPTEVSGCNPVNFWLSPCSCPQEGDISTCELVVKFVETTRGERVQPDGTTAGAEVC